MVSLTLSITEEFKKLLQHFSWVNWSEIAREEAMKKLILESYLKTGTVTDEDWRFCEENDWHPVDELPLKEEFLKKIEVIRREKAIPYRSVADFLKKLK